MIDSAAPRCPIHDMPDCSPLLNGCGWSPEREVVHRAHPHPRSTLSGGLTVTDEPMPSAASVPPEDRETAREVLAEIEAGQWRGDETAAPLACDCEPTVYGDGSVGHEDDCAIFPWCPHEVVAYACLMPCNCPCGSCKALSEAHRG